MTPITYTLDDEAINIRIPREQALDAFDDASGGDYVITKTEHFLRALARHAINGIDEELEGYAHDAIDAGEGVAEVGEEED